MSKVYRILKNSIFSYIFLGTLIGVNCFASDFFTNGKFESFCKGLIISPNPFGEMKLNSPETAISDNKIYLSKLNTSDNSWEILKKNINEKDQSHQIIKKFYSKIIDIKAGRYLWVLFRTELLGLDYLNDYKVSKVIVFDPIVGHSQNFATGMALERDDVYVSHAIDGIKLFSGLTGELKKNIDLGLLQNQGHVSTAVGITEHNGSILVAVDNLTEPKRSSKPFNGIVEINIKNEHTFKQFSYPRGRFGIISPKVKLVASEGFLYVNNWGVLQKINLEKMRARKLARPIPLLPRVEVEQKSIAIQIIGDLIKSGDSIYSCAFYQHIKKTGVPELKGTSFSF